MASEPGASDGRAQPMQVALALGFFVSFRIGRPKRALVYVCPIVESKTGYSARRRAPAAALRPSRSAAPLFGSAAAAAAAASARASSAS